MPDFDDFDALFDFDDLSGEPEGPDFGEAGVPEEAPRRRVPHSARVLAEGETGVAFDALVLFAAPLFEFYGLDLADAFALKDEGAEVEPDVLAVLETARLLWAYFSLPPAERARRRDALAAHLVGPEPTEDDWLDIEGLLDAVEPYWRAMLPEERSAAEQAGAPVLGFDALVQHPAFALAPDHDAQTYGPDALSEIEARARFAQPLLDDPAALGDPDAFERAMDRASAYWTLALTPPGEREAALREVVARFAGANGEQAAVEAEARRMVARFGQLFPERAPAA
jgi:hypothetical protein